MKRSWFNPFNLWCGLGFPSRGKTKGAILSRTDVVGFILRFSYEKTRETKVVRHMGGAMVGQTRKKKTVTD